MTLPTFFSVTPVAPFINTYDPDNSSAPYAYARIYTYGGFTRDHNPYRIGDQYNNNEIIVGYDAVPLADQDLYLKGHPFRCCIMRLCFGAYNVSTENQFLLLFELRGIWGAPSALFFVGLDLVDTTELSGVEKHAILLDCPGPSSIEMWVRLASNDWSAAMAFRGVDCYLL